MQEFQCSKCGYRKWENEAVDMMMSTPMFGSFGMSNIPPMMGTMNWVQDVVCPNCGNASSWRPIINNDNFLYK